MPEYRTLFGSWRGLRASAVYASSNLDAMRPNRARAGLGDPAAREIAGIWRPAAGFSGWRGPCFNKLSENTQPACRFSPVTTPLHSSRSPTASRCLPRSSRSTWPRASRRASVAPRAGGSGWAARRWASASGRCTSSACSRSTCRFRSATTSRSRSFRSSSRSSPRRTRCTSSRRPGYRCGASPAAR